MLGTAMRPSEVFALRWENVLLNGQDGMLQIKDGKSRAARRMLPLVPAVFNALKVRHAAQKKPCDRLGISGRHKVQAFRGWKRQEPARRLH